MRRRLLVATLLALVACHRAPPRSQARTVRDPTGRTVSLPAEVKRVVSLAASTTEVVYALGAGDRVVGVDRFSDWPPEAERVPRVGGETDPSLERVVGLKPDLVLTATTANSVETVRTLERLGLPVYVSQAPTLETIFDDIARIGDALGRADAARALIASMRARLDAVRTTAAALPPVRAAIVVWTAPLVIAGSGNHVTELLELAGGRNIAADAKQTFPSYSVERLIERAPEVLIVGEHAAGPPPLADLERLTTIPAVRNHRIRTIDGNLVFRPGPRIADGAETLLRLLHEQPADGGAR